MIVHPLQAPVTARQLWFTGPGRVEIREQSLEAPAAGMLRVRTLRSAVSAGTEMLVYRGQIPASMALDATLQSLRGTLSYPLQYGYACVGRVEELGAAVDPAWLGRLVFAFAPHASRFVAAPEALVPVPEDIEPEQAVFLANMETAVNLVQDGSPGIGEKVVVLGQGIVGLLLSGILAEFPLGTLIALDAIADRRACALAMGVRQVGDPFSREQIAAVLADLSAGHGGAGADLVYEVSGVPEALNLAIDLSGFASRIVIGSWYGTKSASIDLGGVAHRNRLRITTSQVSTLAPELLGRWDKARRFDVAWDMLRRLQPQHLITHRSEFAEAPALYENLQQTPADILQAVFVYD